jgi:hypothetical protein
MCCSGQCKLGAQPLAQAKLATCNRMHAVAGAAQPRLCIENDAMVVRPDASIGMSVQMPAGSPGEPGSRMAATLRRDEPSLTASHMLQVRRYHRNGQVDVTTVYLEATRTYFGGRRLWFRCPRCEGRCRVLYGTWRIACRRCHRLRYLSQTAATRSLLSCARF